MEGARCSYTYQITDMPLLSTLYEPLSKQLISVLGAMHHRIPVILVPAVAVVWLYPDVRDSQKLTTLWHPCTILPLAFAEVSKVVQ